MPENQEQQDFSFEAYTQLRDAYNAAVEGMNAQGELLDGLRSNPDSTEEQIESADAEFNARVVSAAELKAKLESKEARDRARAQFPAVPTGSARIAVREPDMYTSQNRSFFTDLYNAQMRGDPAAAQRISKHQALEVEKRAVATATLGGIIPPQYLVDMYAKASRNGRIFADQVNQQELPEEGMSVIVPRLTQGLAADVQATESSVVATQDPTEVDLTVPVRTIAGYSPVSRQALERSQYSDTILFEDLIARYWARVDVQALNGSGASGQMLGLLQTAGIISVTVSTITAAGVWPKIADAAQQVSTAMGGIGYLPDKMFMHPRRWAFFEAALDSQSRPLIVPTAIAMNPMGTPDNTGGWAGGFGGPVGVIQGFPVYLDANIPTTLGAATNEDRIIIVCSPIVHLWERPGDPVTVSFEQQAGTSLQVQLVVYGYAAFTAGRYPAASAVLTGLTPPTF